MFLTIPLLVLAFLFIFACIFLNTAWRLEPRRFRAEMRRLGFILAAWWAGMLVLLIVGSAIGDMIDDDNMAFTVVTILVVFYTSAFGTGVCIARAIDRVKSIPPDHPACPACGYNLRGLPDDRPCPECGSPREACDAPQPQIQEPEKK